VGCAIVPEAVPLGQYNWGRPSPRPRTRLSASRPLWAGSGPVGSDTSVRPEHGRSELSKGQTADGVFAALFLPALFLPALFLQLKVDAYRQMVARDHRERMPTDLRRYQMQAAAIVDAIEAAARRERGIGLQRPGSDALFRSVAQCSAMPSTKSARRLDSQSLKSPPTMQALCCSIALNSVERSSRPA